MSVTYTPEQQKAIDLHGCNILVSAAAGSGKTAVLAERIIRRVCDEEHPVDIDRLLVVTFTNAAAAEMRERIAVGISKRLAENQESAHIQKQATLLHNAQITTIDSFCLFLLRNHFNEIGLDPAFRIADEGEIKLMQQEVLQELFEDSYASGSEKFRYCVEYFCPGGKESVLEQHILNLSRYASSFPWPDRWLEERKEDYGAETVEELCSSSYASYLMVHLHNMVEGCVEKLERVKGLCEASDGPYMYGALVDGELEQLQELLGCSSLEEYGVKLSGIDFGRLPSKKDGSVSAVKRELAKVMRAEVKETLQKLEERFFATPLELAVRQGAACREPVATLIDLVLDFHKRMREKKQEKKVIDFSDMEHYALDILLKTQDENANAGHSIGDVVKPSSVALEYREHFAEILIDEYQDSNIVQEYLLKAVSGEEDGHYNRFMVGDVKQSIYKFRLARPELFLEKYNTYQAAMDEKTVQDDKGGKNDKTTWDGSKTAQDDKTAWDDSKTAQDDKTTWDDSKTAQDHKTIWDDSKTAQDDRAVKNDRIIQADCRRIDLSKNFRSRISVVDAVNDVFGRLMSEAVGKIPYDERAALYPGAEYPVSEGCESELLLIEKPGKEDEMGDKAAEALSIAGKIKELCGSFQVLDKESRMLRPAKYSDMVILLRTNSGWDEEFKAVLEKEGIPVYITSKTGYFAASEVQELLQLLRVLDNPCQDIPLFGVMKSMFGGFSEEEIAQIRSHKKGCSLYEALKAFAEGNVQESDTSQDSDHTEMPGDMRRQMQAQESGDVQRQMQAQESGDVQRQAQAQESGDVQRQMQTKESGDVQRQAQAQESGDVQRQMQIKESGDVQRQAQTQESGDVQRQAQTQEFGGAATATTVKGIYEAKGTRQMSLQEKVASFLQMIASYRECTVYLPIRELLTKLVEDFGYLDYVTALPAGSKRRANVEMLFTKASDFEKTSYFGLFHFIRYMEQLEKYDVDYGEAGLLDENADVVRIMSIHKSKGLEFPITFVSGLHKRFNMQDVNQSLILDMDLGLATDYVDPEKRIRNKTLRRMALSGKLREDSLSEELRVLYVAMTRAREKLILTGVLEKAAERWEQFCQSYASGDGRLTYLEFMEAGSYLDFLLPVLPGTSIKVSLVDQTESVRGEITEQMLLLHKREVLQRVGQAGRDASEESETVRDGIAGGDAPEEESETDRDEFSGGDVQAYENRRAFLRLKNRLNAIYPYAGLAELYTKTTVSELKIAAMADKDEAAYHTFEEREILPYIPLFRREEEKISGTVRGNAYHRVMELLDFEALMELPPEELASGVHEFLCREVESRRLKEEYFQAIREKRIVKFLRSDLARRMWKAQKKGTLYREQPFVLGIDARRLKEGFPKEETVLIQGIIDVFFVEEDGLVLLDYKTDSVSSMAELWNRYETQMDYYQEAIRKLMEMPVKERILYSFHLEDYLPL